MWATNRGAPLHARADPCGILDQQDIIDLVGKQIAKSAQGNPAAICKTLTVWSSLQRTPCSKDVFKHACEHLGFWGAEAREKAICWATAPIGMQGPFTHKDYLAGAEPDWKRVFEKLCLCVRKDRGEDGKSLGLLRRWANVLRARSPRVSADTNAACAMVMEMSDHARYGYVPHSDRRWFQPPIAHERALVCRRWYELLAMAMIGPDSPKVFRRVSPVGQIYLMSQQVNQALANANGSSLILPDPVQRAFDTAFASGFFTPNMYIQRGNTMPHVLPPDITVDVAAFAMPSGQCRDTEYEGGAKANVILDAVLSHPDYDPRKCINKPSTYDGRESGCVTLLGLYLALFHTRGDWQMDPVVWMNKSGKQATLRRILEHPLQNLRQRSNSAGLAHMCLLQTIRCEDDPSITKEFRIKDGVRAWRWRYQALNMLWETSCDECRDDTAGTRVHIWLCKDRLGRTPHELFEHKWGIFRSEVLLLLAPALRSKNHPPRPTDKSITRATALKLVKYVDETAYTPIKKLFTFAEAMAS